MKQNEQTWTSSELIYLFVDGEADDLQKAQLFGALSNNSELQAELADAIRIDAAARDKTTDSALPAAVTAALFERAGVAAVGTMSTGLGGSVAGGWLFLKRFGMPLVAGFLGAALALLFIPRFGLLIDLPEAMVADNSVAAVITHGEKTKEQESIEEQGRVKEDIDAYHGGYANSISNQHSPNTPSNPNIIDFEPGTYNSGNCGTYSQAELDLVDNNYFQCAYGVTFHMGSLGGTPPPTIAEVGNPRVAWASRTTFSYYSPSQECSVDTNESGDKPTNNKDVGCFFITDDGNGPGQNPDPLYVDYHDLRCTEASGFLMDVDGGPGSVQEGWEITAVGIGGNTHTVYVLSPDYINYDSTPPTPQTNIVGGDGEASYWAVDLGTDPIDYIKFSYIGHPRRGVGLAFDEFAICSPQIPDDRGIGDGNDVAFDDFSLRKKGDMPTAYCAFDITTSTSGTNITITATAVTNPLPAGFDVEWTVTEADSNTWAPIGGTTMTYPWDPDTTNFSGYCCVPGSATPGAFSTSKCYIITRKVTNCCYNDCEYRWYLSARPEGRVAEETGETTFYISNDLENWEPVVGSSTEDDLRLR